MLHTRRDSVLLALLVVFLWATSWVLIKIGLRQIPALTFAGLRYLLAFAALLPFQLSPSRWMALRRLPGRTWWKLAALGLLLYALTQGAQFVALSFLPAVTVNLLWSLSPMAVAVLGARFLHERPSRLQWLGVLVAVSGAIAFFYPPALPAGLLMGLGVSGIGVLANAGASVLGRSINRQRNLSPLTITTVSMGIGSVILFSAGVVFQGLPRIDLQGWLIILWLAIVNTAFAFTLWNFTLQRLTATESSVINGTMLIWIPVLAYFFLGEGVTGLQVLSLVIVGVGTLAVQLGRSE